jgi:inositol-pentakisphosphate 2-kinase
MDVAHADVVDTAPEEWRYISEGGATIVFSYAGRAHHQFDGMALRLRKVPWTTIPNADRTVRDECDDPSIEFQHTVMSRLIPAEHLPCLKTVHVNKDWLEALDADRPLKRRAEDHIDVSRRKAVLATDLVGGAGLAVEIRVSWLPSP